MISRVRKKPFSLYRMFNGLLMAKLFIGTKEILLADGAELGPICEKAGLAINCRTGVCGACLIQVAEGKENLSPLTPEETDLGLDDSRRLACQCRIVKGIVRINF